MPARLVALTTAFVIVLATVLGGSPVRCLLASHCERCEDVGPGIGLGGCTQMAPATPLSPDRTPHAEFTLAPPSLRSKSVPAPIVIARVKQVRAPASSESGPPGGLPLRI